MQFVCAAEETRQKIQFFTNFPTVKFCAPLRFQWICAKYVPIAQWIPTIFYAFLPLLILELFIPPLFGFVG